MGIHSPSSRSLIRLENILIIGNGGRENSLAWAIQKNELVKKVYLIPGNAGSERIHKSERIKIDVNNKNELLEKLDSLKIDLVVIGPEIPLANGLADLLRKKDFKVFGPNKDGAKLEFSKSWAKEFSLPPLPIIKIFSNLLKLLECFELILINVFFECY